MTTKEIQEEEPIDAFFFPIRDLLNKAAVELSKEDYQSLLEDVRRLWKMGVDVGKDSPILQAKDKEIAAKDAEIEKLKGLLEEFVTGNHADEEAEYLWQAYRKEKGIE